MRYLVIAIFSMTVLLISCNGSGDDNQNEIIQTDVSVGVKVKDSSGYSELSDSLADILIKKSIQEGDSKSYNQLSNSRKFLSPDLLFTSMVMANKFNDAKACFDIYFMLCEEGFNSFSANLGTVDKKTKGIGLYYLMRSYELGYIEAKETVYELYLKNGLDVPKSSDFLKF